MKKISVKVLAAVLCLFAFFLSACSAADTEQDTGKIKVVATLFPQYDFARIIGGEYVQVTKLLPWGADSHSYEATVKDIKSINGADLFIYTGKDMEIWAENLVSSSIGEDTSVLDLSKEGIELRYLEEEGHSHSHPDPHIWTDPGNAVIMVRSIEEELSTLDPENSEYYKENAEALIGELEVLESELRAVSDKLSGKTIYFGGRFAFLYMFREYGMNYMSVYDGCAEDAEPGIKRINEMVDAMRGDGAEIIFCEEMSEGKVAKSIADEVGAEVLVLHSCHNLSKNEAEAGESYLSIMRDNIEKLKLCTE